MTSDGYAQAFIRRQLGEYQLAGITGMTAKQRERIAQLDVVSPERKRFAGYLMYLTDMDYGRPPQGRMRVIDMNTGEITVVGAKDAPA